VLCCAENTATINQQKRKLSRQHDVLLNLKGKYSRSDGKFCDENSKLTEEYKRITEHFKDMQVCLPQSFIQCIQCKATKPESLKGRCLKPSDQWSGVA
jgi:hypothetical protein